VTYLFTVLVNMKVGLHTELLQSVTNHFQVTFIFYKMVFLSALPK